MNQSDLSREIGVASSAVTNWIKARKEPTLSNICKIIKVLNCTFEELVE